MTTLCRPEQRARGITCLQVYLLLFHHRCLSQFQFCSCQLASPMGRLQMQIKCTQTNKEDSLYTNTSNHVRQQRQRHRIMLSACLSPTWMPVRSPTVCKLCSASVGWQGESMFSGLDWKGLNMLIGYPNLLLPCQSCWQHRRPDVRDCAVFSMRSDRVMKRKKKIMLNMKIGLCEDKDLSLTMPHLLTDMHH